MDPELAFIMTNMAHVRVSWRLCLCLRVCVCTCLLQTLLFARAPWSTTHTSTTNTTQAQTPTHRQTPSNHQVRRGHLVLDPYLGTGSILVAAAQRGAATMGTDIDARVVMRGRPNASAPGGRYTVWSNFAQYGLPPPLGVLRADVHRHPFRSGLTEVFDAVLGDPPYGVRAGGRKSRAKPAGCVRDPVTHIPSTAPYPLTECLDDLVELAAQLLVTGVSWL